MVTKPKTILVMAFSVFIASAACYMLGFGGAVLCCAPVHAGASFWQPEKFSFGLLPMCTSAFAFAFAFRLWAPGFGRRRSAWLAGCVVVIFAIALDSSLFLKYRGKQDERITLVWNAELGTFSWGSGEVRLPPGFTYKTDHGFDTFMGHFTSQDGELVIEHDIGELASEHGTMGQSESLTQGSRVIIGRARVSDDKGNTAFFSKVSFPDSGCANFYLESSKENDAGAIEFIATSFRPIGWTPVWVRPLLPEVLRSDCRYRLKLPERF